MKYVGNLAVLRAYSSDRYTPKDSKMIQIVATWIDFHRAIARSIFPVSFLAASPAIVPHFSVPNEYNVCFLNVYELTKNEKILNVNTRLLSRPTCKPKAAQKHYNFNMQLQLNLV